MTHSLVFDIGKTHARALVFDGALNCDYTLQRRNAVIGGDPYPRLDTDGLWAWMLGAIREAATRFPVSHLNVTTHGATAALVDPARDGDGLVLPVLDYECESPAQDRDYDALRPPFSETLSPALPAGLNLGRQLWWLQRRFSRAFACARAVLTYPQYWAWRLGGEPCAEWTSLGCHTDLWSPRACDYSGLVEAAGWRALFPPIRDVRSARWQVSPALARETGLDPGCAVHTGVHDSNASLANYLHAFPGEAFVLVSTGTWVVSMAPGASLGRLDPARDMLANVDVRGDAVPCARFMGGREYERICALTGADPSGAVTAESLQSVLDAQVFALPDFSAGSGPFPGLVGGVVGRAPDGTALATLYVALMIDVQLSMFGTSGKIIIEGPFAANPVFGGLLAALTGRSVHRSAGTHGTARGAALLCNWGRIRSGGLPTPCPPCELRGLDLYRLAWRERVEQREEHARG